MANTLNNFGLAEITLKTANKWCTADIKVKIDSAEIENIKSEYLRSGVEVFGVSGTYGYTVDTVTIPAGIYELVVHWDYPAYTSTIPINLYRAGHLYNGFGVDNGAAKDIYFYDSFGSDDDEQYVTFITHNYDDDEYIEDNKTWLDYLVFVPTDTNINRDAANLWYSLMHPYVSCMDQDTKQELTVTELANRIMASEEESCPNCGSSDYGEYEGEMRCNHCYYPYSGYCDEHGYYNTYYESVCPGCYPYQCFHCDARFESKEALEEHQINDLGYTRCEYCGQLYDPESGQHECSGTCNHSYGDYGSSVYISGYNEGYHTISCRYCDYETTESCSIGDDNTCTICGQSYNTPDDAYCNDCGSWASNWCSSCGSYFCDDHWSSHSCSGGSEDGPIQVCSGCRQPWGTCSCEYGDTYPVCSWCGGEGCLCGQEN